MNNNTLSANAHVSGMFSVSKIMPSGDIVVVSPLQDNLITNFGLDSLAGPSSFMGAVQVGTGTAAPTFTDTSLGARLAGKTIDSVPNWSLDQGSGVGTATGTFTFPVGSATGNLTEIGLSANTTGNVCTRALFKDAGGNPTAITVASDEQLLVTYIVTITYSLTSTSSVTDPSSGITYTMSFLPVTGGLPDALTGAQGSIFDTSNYIQMITTAPGAIWDYPGNASLLGNPATLSPYVNGTYYSENSFASGATGTVTGVQTIYSGGAGGCGLRIKIGVSPAFSKAVGQSIKFKVRMQWARSP